MILVTVTTGYWCKASCWCRCFFVVGSDFGDGDGVIVCVVAVIWVTAGAGIVADVGVDVIMGGVIVVGVVVVVVVVHCCWCLCFPLKKEKKITWS